MVDDYTGTCPRCGSPRWVSVSLDGAWTRRPQCVPCGAIHPYVLGQGSEAIFVLGRERAERIGGQVESA